MPSQQHSKENEKEVDYFGKSPILPQTKNKSSELHTSIPQPPTKLKEDILADSHLKEPTLADIMEYMKATKHQHSQEMILGFNSLREDLTKLKNEITALKDQYNQSEEKIKINHDNISDLQTSSTKHEERLGVMENKSRF